MLHATWLRSQPSVHFLQYEWFGLRAQTKSRLHIIRIFLSSFCDYLNTRHSNFRLVMRITLWFLSQTWAMLYRGLLPESQYLPGRGNVLRPGQCWQDAAAHCSQVSDGDKDQLGPVTLMTWCHDSVTRVRGCHVVTNQTDTCDVCSCHNTASSRYICQHQH